MAKVGAYRGFGALIHDAWTPPRDTFPPQREHRTPVTSQQCARCLNPFEALFHHKYCPACEGAMRHFRPHRALTLAGGQLLHERDAYVHDHCDTSRKRHGALDQLGANIGGEDRETEG